MAARLTILAVVPIVGLIGLLLADGLWDAPFFALALLPLLLGIGLPLVRKGADT